MLVGVGWCWCWLVLAGVGWCWCWRLPLQFAWEPCTHIGNLQSNLHGTPTHTLEIGTAICLGTLHIHWSLAQQFAWKPLPIHWKFPQQFAWVPCMHMGGCHYNLLGNLAHTLEICRAICFALFKLRVWVSKAYFTSGFRVVQILLKFRVQGFKNIFYLWV